MVIPEAIKMDENTKLLPLAKLYGKEYLIDVENRQFRNFKKSDEVIWMHSEQGRKMIEDIQGSCWESYGVSTGAAGSIEV
jgi:hypothetical protein